MNVSLTFVKALALCLIVCILLQGCGFLTAGKRRLNEYCPGLKISINGFSWSGGSAGDVFILKYDRGFQKKAEAYFADKANGFSSDNGRKYLDIKDGDNQAIEEADSIVSKTIVKGKKSATMIFDKTTGSIIIIEVEQK